MVFEHLNLLFSMDLLVYRPPFFLPSRLSFSSIYDI